MRLLRKLCREQCNYLFAQQWQLDSCDLPDRVHVNTEVIMNNAMAKPDNLRPRNFGMAVLQRRRDLECSLSRNHQLTQNRILGQTGGQELLLPDFGNIIGHGSRSFDDIQQAQGITPRR